MKNQFYIFLFISNLFSQIDYNSQIQPIFDNNCISCHNNGGGYAGGLDLSSYDNVLAGGNSNNSIIPNDHSNSLLYERITLPEENYLSMPQFGSPLLESDITLISQWIDQGALETSADVECYADDGTDGVMIWETCYSIENTTALGWPLFIPDSTTSFPMNLFSLTNLITLNITNSNISDPLPSEIGALVNLTRLNLSNNQISGEIPSEIGNLINLTSLNLSSNQLSGNIPIEIFNMSNLKGQIEPAFIGTVFYPGLDLSNNLLDGSIPEQLGLLENLKSIDLSYNQLTGNLPVELYTLDSLQSLNLSNNLLSGEISQDIGNLLNLEGITTYAHNSSVLYDALNLSNNLFTGIIPESICDLNLDWSDNYMNEYQGFDISDNQFCAPIPTCVEPFIGFQDTSNCYSDCYADDGTDGVMIWEICHSIENTTYIGWPLSIPDSATTLPENLFRLSNLTILSIHHTNISGSISPNIGNLPNLTRLDLSHNDLSGEIPSEIGNLPNLIALNLSANQLSGNIPSDLYQLSNLKGEMEYVSGPGGGASIFHMGLNLSDNNLTGSIQEEISNFVNLESLDLSYNEFSGNLPSGLFTLDSLKTLNLSNNLLTGEISNEIGNLLNLQGVTTYAHNSMTQYDALNLSNNLFTGLIPASICDLTLEWDDTYMNQNQGFSISDNQFCAPFPSCVEPFIGIQDTSNCSPVTSQIEGRWLAPALLGQTANTMYEFIDDLRYTYYCSSDTNECDSTYWNSLDTSNAIPNPNPYTFINDTLTIDIFFGNTWQRFATFECDGYVVSLGDSSFGEWSWHRVGFNTSECENQDLSSSHINNTPGKFRLNQNYPNPFNPITTLKYDLSQDAFVDLTIYDMLGNIVSTIVSKNQNSGSKSVQWDSTNDQGELVSAGVYLYKIQVGNHSRTKKMILLK